MGNTGNVIGYVRVSTEEQGATGAGLEAQRAAIEGECARRRWTLVRVEEDVLSARTMRRPEAGGQWKGQFQLRTNNEKGKFRAGTVSTLSSVRNSATWSGVGAWNGAPNYAYTISVVDEGSSGARKGDKISIEITSPAGVVVYSTGGLQTLKGGNLTVH